MLRYRKEDMAYCYRTPSGKFVFVPKPGAAPIIEKSEIKNLEPNKEQDISRNPEQEIIKDRANVQERIDSVEAGIISGDLQKLKKKRWELSKEHFDVRRENRKKGRKKQWQKEK